MKHRFLRHLIFLLPVIALLGAVVPMATPAQAAVGTIIYVNQGVTGGSHNGFSRQIPKLQHAHIACRCWRLGLQQRACPGRTLGVD